MNHTQVVLCSATILFPAIAGIIKFKNTERIYYPFIIYLWVATLNEIISYFISLLGYSTTLNNNIFILAEALLILWQFKKWEIFHSYKKGYVILALALVAIWLLDNSNIEKLTSITSPFRLFYSFMIVLMSIHINNRLVFTYKKNLLKSPVFIICCGFTIYFTYKILVEVFWIYGLNSTKNFRIDVYVILTWINVLINILYLVAIICIPKKPHYTEL